jgi:hypothetical protein
MTTMTIEQDTMRAEFEARYKHLDLTWRNDVWGRPEYVHSHVGALWEGYQAGRAAAQAAEPVAPGELPTTEAGWLHRCDQRFAEGYQKGRASAAQGAEPVARLKRFSVAHGAAAIYDHLDHADVLIRVDGDWESEADRDQYVNALCERLQASQSPKAKESST